MAPHPIQFGSSERRKPVGRLQGVFATPTIDDTEMMGRTGEHREKQAHLVQLQLEEDSPS
jgi:hypothetical protein